ncbi:MAG: hypothetical protein HG457_005785 [Flavobacteriaceae bacterium]|jgi:hypothetical protein|nr:hypothetical protein [Flavobacteriaceae bacterium]
MMENVKYKLYLQDLVAILKERLEGTMKEEYSEFDLGMQMECYNILDIIKQQAEAFNIPLAELGLEHYDLEKFMKRR